MNINALKSIDKLISLVEPLLPEGWTCTEAIGLDMMGGSSPSFVHCMATMPGNARYHGFRNETPEQRKTRQQYRAAWREESQAQATELADKIRKSVKGVKVQADTTAVYVYQLR